ncbi:site-specific integrase [Maribrevibacterium harenarium]|uniref:Site-specific integrase n=1 Tax=Maribrevibacterium harenarium TaxID=2589817 RepID=A0A501WHL4_9GAMM|nr:site-specific integrase [Maribrevibacterium harenarium]TPE45106.1 site-specific integrase [Maribrevibacterium harenarium]
MIISIHQESNAPVVHRNQDDLGLSERAKARLKSLYTDTDTYKGYQSDFRVFQQWRIQNKRSGAPTADDLCNFIADQSEGILSSFNRTKGILEDGGCVAHSTLSRRRAAILSILGKAGIEFSKDESARIADILASCKLVEAGEPLRKRGAATPLMPAHVGEMIRCPAMQSAARFKRLRDQALLAFFLVTGARKSELLGRKGVVVGDISFDKNGMAYKRIVLKKGFNSRQKTFKGRVPPNSSKTSAYQLIKQYYDELMAHNGVNEETPFFIRLNRNGEPHPSFSAVSPRKLSDWLIHYAISANLPDSTIEHLKGHSLRVGAVVYLYEIGMDKRKISEITGQTEATIEHYAKQRKSMSYDGGL